MSMADETFSFRWGIPILDSGYTTIPNFIIDNYAAAGVSRVEFLTIVHLARYQFESASAECRPSVATVARAMGYSRRGLRKILAGLEERALLTRQYRPGYTTLYDFSGFSRAVLELSTGPEPQFLPNELREERQPLPGGEPQFRGDGNPSSAEEEKKEEKQQEEKEAAGLPVFCSIHNEPMERREKDGQSWYSHKLPDGTWCKGTPGDVARDHAQQSPEHRWKYVTQFDGDPIAEN